jgi:hypothetical protein
VKPYVYVEEADRPECTFERWLELIGNLHPDDRLEYIERRAFVEYRQRHGRKPRGADELAEAMGEFKSLIAAEAGQRGWLPAKWR